MLRLTSPELQPRKGRRVHVRTLDADYSSHDLAGRPCEQWRERLGGDDPFTLSIAHSLASALQDMGLMPLPVTLDEDSLARERRLRGADHGNTLNPANMLALDLRNLGGYQAARELHEDTLARRRVLGADHPDTLNSAHDLAADLRGLGKASDNF